MQAIKSKYGIPVSGRVDMMLHKKLKEDANKLGLTMSRMVDTALSEWAQTAEIRTVEKQLRERVAQLEKQLLKASKRIKEREQSAKSQTDDFKIEKQRINGAWRKAIGKFIKKISNTEKENVKYLEIFTQISEHVSRA